MTKPRPRIAIARVYDAPASGDAYRVLVDRLWPRGVSKDALALDEWAKELAPSTELRKWFGHEAARWESFRMKYFRELTEHGDKLEELRTIARQQPLLLLYAAKDEDHNNAVALREFLQR